MSEFFPKNLANGVATTSKVGVYTVPVGRTALVRSVMLTNTSVATVTTELTVNFGTGSRYCGPKNLSLQPGVFFEHDVGLSMEAGDIFEIQASANSAIDFIVSGVEEQ